MSNPIISIIMGTYNPDFNRLSRAIESIKKQTFKNWECIICDDASNNGVFEWLLSNYGNDRRFILIKNDKNMRLAATLNKCIDYAQGEYIARMDDDDISLSSRLFEQICFLQSNKNIAFVSSSAKIFDGQKDIGEWENKQFPDKYDFLWGSPFIHPATMYKRNIFDGGLKYKTNWLTRRPPEDYEFFMRLYCKGLRGANIKEPLIRYYVNPVAMKKRKYVYSIEEAIIRLKGFKSLKMIFPFGWLFIFKPLIVGLIPREMLFMIQKYFIFIKKGAGK